MKTDDFITSLSKDIHKASSTRDGFRWLTGTLVLLTLPFFILRIRPDFTDQIYSVFFQFETGLYLTVFIAATLIAYRSAIPLLLERRDIYIGGTLFAILGLVIFSKISLPGWESEIQGELDFHRGMCGPIILAIALSESALLVVLARRAAPTNLVLTGTWVALSAGAMGLFVMQFICDHENFSHLALWHAGPVFILTSAGAAFGKRLLKW